MKRVYLGLVLAALLMPVALRTLAWERAVITTPEAADVEVGKNLFNHKWTPNDPLCEGGDGIGPVFNAESCVACHFQGGVGGSGKLEHNVTVYRSSELFGGRNTVTGTLHMSAISPDFLETMNRVDNQLPATSKPSLDDLKKASTVSSTLFSQRNTPALFGAKKIDEITDRDIIAIARWQQLSQGMTTSNSETTPVGRVLFTDGKVGKFGWKSQTPSLLEFVQGACANELGLSNPNQPQPKSIARLDYQPKRGGTDLTLKQCQQMEAFIAALPAPERVQPADEKEAERAHKGEALFQSMGCATCHVPNVGTVYGIYSDLLLHRMGRDLEAQGSYNTPQNDGDPGSTPLPDEWRTPPLWGVADSAPYLHDGRALTLADAIRLHDGQGAGASRAFRTATAAERDQLISFLKTLRAPQQQQHQ